MTKYFFIFGNTPELSRAELHQLFNYFNIIPTRTVQFTQRVDTYDFPETIDAKKLMHWVGGTIKIGEVIAEIGKIESKKLAEIISVATVNDWGLSNYAEATLNLLNLASEIKQELKPPSRFVIPKKNERDISAVVLHKQNLTEFVLLFDKSRKSWLVGVTQAFQDVDEWAKQDRGRPFADSKSGMLPVKIARILVNLALPDRAVDQRILLDPFCGMGTILSGALLTGWQAVGSDYSPEVINKARHNLTWFTTMYRYIAADNWRLIVSDATHASEKIQPNSVDAIVTEPYLGPPFETVAGQLKYRGKTVNLETIKNTLKGLEKLYLGCFKEWRELLKSTGKIVIIFPEIVWQGKKYSVKKPIDNCEMLGYTLSQGPFEYARPQAVVRRKIYVFRKIKSQRSKGKS